MSKICDGRGMSWGRLWGASLLILLVPSCTWSRPPDEDFIGEKLAEASVGPKGGELVVSGANLTIPKGALDAEVDVQLEQLSSIEAATLASTPSSVKLVTPPSRFTPHGLQFSKPVSMELKVPPQSQNETPRVVMKLEDEKDKTWEVVPGAKISPQKATFKTSSFSIYGLFDDPNGLAETLAPGAGGSGGGAGASGGAGATGGSSASGGAVSSGGAATGAGGSSAGGTAGTAGTVGAGGLGAGGLGAGGLGTGATKGTGGAVVGVGGEIGVGGIAGSGASGGSSAGGAGGVGAGGAMGGTAGASIGAFLVYDGIGASVLADNQLSFTGGFYVLEDSAGATDGLVHSDLDPDTATNVTLEPSAFDAQTKQACVSGTVAQVTGLDSPCYPPYYYYPYDTCEFGSLWGGGIGMDMTPTAGVDFTALNMWAISFAYSGDFEGANLRITAVDSSGTEYCKDLGAGIAPGNHVVPLTELVENCWDVPGRYLDPADVLSFQWTIPSTNMNPIQVSNFCLEQVVFLDFDYYSYYY